MRGHYVKLKRTVTAYSPFCLKGAEGSLIRTAAAAAAAAAAVSSRSVCSQRANCNFRVEEMGFKVDEILMPNDCVE